MTALDLIVILIVGATAFSGYRRGFVHEILSLAAWVAAIVAVKTFHTPVTNALTDSVGSVGVAAVLAFLLVFGIVFVAAKLLAARAGVATRRSAIGPVDRVLGIGLGALKGLLGATILFLVATLGTRATESTPDARPAWLTDARTYPLLNASSRALVDFVDRRRNRPLPTDEELNR